MVPLKQIINGLLENDIYDLYQWIIFLSQKKSCKQCIEQGLVHCKIPNCNNCIPSKKLISRLKTTLNKTLEKRGDKTNG